jgi:plastocyanin
VTSLARRIAVVLIAFLVLLAVSLSLVQVSHSPKVAPQESTAVAGDLPVPPPPPLTATMKAVLEKSTGFSALVSYTDAGFEPAHISVLRGQTVRFTNNSLHTMWIMSKGGADGVYPAAPESCGQSAFDTCKALAPHEIWEFTFEVPGTWEYQNNAGEKDRGTVVVK